MVYALVWLRKEKINFLLQRQVERVNSLLLSYKKRLFVLMGTSVGLKRLTHIRESNLLDSVY